MGAVTMCPQNRLKINNYKSVCVLNIYISLKKLWLFKPEPDTKQKNQVKLPESLNY